MTRRIVINELRAWNRKAKANGHITHITSNPSDYSEDLWHQSACAYNPHTGQTVFLVIMKPTVS